MAKRALSSHRLGLLITIGSAISFGAWPSAVRAAYADGGNVSFAMLAITAARLLLLAVLCAAQKKKIFQNRADTRSAVAGGFFQAIATFGAMAAVAFLPGPLAIVIIFTNTLMLLLLMIARGDVKADTATLATTASALVGLTFVLDLYHKQSSANLYGMALALLAAAAIASRLYIYGQQLKTRHPVVVGVENFIMALLFMPLVVLFQRPEAPHSPAGLGWLALGCAAQAFGTLGQFYAIGLFGAFRFSLFMKLEPIFTTLFAALLIGEYLKPEQYFGILLVVGSLALYQWVEHRRHKKIAATEPT